MPWPKRNLPPNSKAAVTVALYQQPDLANHENHYSHTSQGDVRQLEDPAKKRQVTGGKDKGDHADKRSGSGTGLFPLNSKHNLVKQSPEIR